MLLTDKTKIAAILDNFTSIHFHHLPRELNKTADQLAGKTLKNYKLDNSALKSRKDLIGQEDKLLVVPNLLCEEDFQMTNTVHDFAVRRKQVVFHYLVDIVRHKDIAQDNDLLIKYYLIERNPKDHKKITSTLLLEQPLSQKNLFVHVIEHLTDFFKQSGLNTEIGLMFNGIKVIQPEMVLRKRGILHNKNTDLINEFISASTKFPTIYLHNDEKLIKNHTALLENPKPIRTTKP